MNYIKPVAATLALGLAMPALASKPLPQPHKSSSIESSVIQGENSLRNAKALGAKAFSLSGLVNLHYLHSKVNDASTNTMAINNANLLLKAKINDSMTANLNMVATDADHDVQLDEAFIEYKAPVAQDVQLKVGRTYTAFGQYADPYTLTPSLIQVLSQANETVLGVSASEKDMYAKVWAYNHAINEGKWAKWGAKIGFKHTVEGVDVALNTSYMSDIRTLSGHSSFVSSLDGFDQKGAWNAHAALQKSGAEVAADYTASIGSLGASAKPRLWHVGAGYGLNFAGHDHKVSLGYEHASHLSENVLVHKAHRYAAYQVGLIKHVDGVISYDEYTPFAAEPKTKMVMVRLQSKF